jgi:DNA-binding SARP family transcriptional activator
LHRDQTLSRETVADLLWGEINPGQSKNYLRKSLWQLQTRLERCVNPDQERFLITDSYWVQINPDIELWLDVAVIEDTFNGVKGKAGRELFTDQAQKIKQAVEFYRGDLLDGWYQEWCIYERERLQYIYIALLDKLMDYHDAQGEPELGLEYGNIILRYDRARERTHRRMMCLYYNAGDRTAGLRQYEKCVTALLEELDVEPARRTRQYFELIRADDMDQLKSRSQSNQKAAGSDNEFDSLKEIAGNLIYIQQLLVSIQNKLESELKGIQQMIKGN